MQSLRDVRYFCYLFYVLKRNKVYTTFQIVLSYPVVLHALEDEETPV